MGRRRERVLPNSGKHQPTAERLLRARVVKMRIHGIRLSFHLSARAFLVGVNHVGLRGSRFDK